MKKLIVEPGEDEERDWSTAQAEIDRFLTPYWTPIREARGFGLTGPRAVLQYGLEHNLFKGVVCPCGRRSVKTILFHRHLVTQLPMVKPWKDPRYFYAAPTRAQAKRIGWEKLLRLIPKWWIASINLTDLRITTVFGSELWVVGLDQPQRIEGDPWDAGVTDETADLRDPETRETHIAPSMSDRDAPLYQIGTPDYKGNNATDYHKQWLQAIRWDDVEEAEQGVPPEQRGAVLRKAMREAVKTGKRIELAGFSWSSEDVMRPSQIAYYRRRMAIFTFNQELRARWQDAPGRAYNEYSEDLHDVEVRYDPTRPICLSLDFNYTFQNWTLCQVEKAPLSGLPIFSFFAQMFREDAALSKVIGDAIDYLVALNPVLFQAEEKVARNGEVYRTLKSPRGVLRFYGDFAGTARNSAASLSNWKQVRRAFPFADYFYLPSENIDTSLDHTNAALRNAMGEVRVRIGPALIELKEDLKYVKRADLLDSDKKQSLGRRGHAADTLRYLVQQVKRAEDIDAATARQNLRKVLT